MRPLLRTIVALVLAAPTAVLGPSPADASPACHAWPANYVATENAKPGDRGWTYVTHTGPTTAQFWLDAVSASCGQQVGVHLAASGVTHFELWRLGFYRGARGRLMASWSALPTVPLTAQSGSADTSGSGQPPMSTADLPQATTAPGPLGQAAGAPGPVDSYPAYASASAASWPVSTTFTITPQMPPGLYELIGTGPDGVPTGAPLVVRDDLGPHALTVVAPTLTWQAYNPWGTADLYAWPNSDGSIGDGSNGEADIVTFNRPTYNLWSHAQLLGQDKGLAQLVDRDGMDVNWIASQDLQSPQAVLYQTHAIVMSRHDEYWTVGMRSVTDGLVSRGVNLIDLGGNNMYHAGRFLDSAQRWYQVRKNANPIHQNDDAYHVSYRFVDSLVNNPQARLLGENFNCISPWVPFVVSDPTFWAWAPQKLRKGRSFPNVVGSESDGPQAGYAAGTVFGSLSPLHCTYAGVDRVAGFSYRVAGRSRAGVIDVGSMNWLCQLTTTTCGDYPRTTVAGERFVTRTTERILIDAAKGPLGRLHRAVGGVKPPVAASYPRSVR